MIAVDGVIESGGHRHHVFGFAMPQVPSVGDHLEHPDGVVWTVRAVHWRVPSADSDGEVSALLVVDPE